MTPEKKFYVGQTVEIGGFQPVEGRIVAALYPGVGGYGWIYTVQVKNRYGFSDLVQVREEGLQAAVGVRS